VLLADPDFSPILISRRRIGSRPSRSLVGAERASSQISASYALASARSWAPPSPRNDDPCMQAIAPGSRSASLRSVTGMVGLIDDAWNLGRPYANA
jgi:hypothetical protein